MLLLKHTYCYTTEIFRYVTVKLSKNEKEINSEYFLTASDEIFKVLSTFEITLSLRLRIKVFSSRVYRRPGLHKLIDFIKIFLAVHWVGFDCGCVGFPVGWTHFSVLLHKLEGLDETKSLVYRSTHR